jgi:hypothetical protein
MDKKFSELTEEEILLNAIGWLTINRPDLDVSEAMKHKCPTCLGFIPNNDRIGEYSGALSRRDNKTEICSACGGREAIEDWLSNT